MRELRPGLWHWQAPHPEWTPDAVWPEQVSSYALDDGTQLWLFDPLAVPDELLALAAERQPALGRSARVRSTGLRASRERNDLVLWLESGGGPHSPTSATGSA